jgi:hypothetical protein
MVPLWPWSVAIAHVIRRWPVPTMLMFLVTMVSPFFAAFLVLAGGWKTWEWIVLGHFSRRDGGLNRKIMVC